jgi:hypothetical protein
MLKIARIFSTPNSKFTNMKFKNLLWMVGMFLLGTQLSFAQDTTRHVDVYGFVMMDAGYNAGQIHPDWYDVVRPTKLSAYKDQYGPDGNFFMSVRQTRFGVKGFTPTKFGLLKTQFEFELFGTGVDAGQTTIRLRHAYGELGKWGAGQTWSPFMDIDVFPNTVEYWGPPGMAFFRNVQVRYMPIQGDTRMTIALERPGASADQGPYSDKLAELGDVKPNLGLPDLSAEYRLGQSWGYVELAGIVRQIKWKDLDTIGPDLSGDAIGYGLNLSTNIKFGSMTIFRGSVVYGAGIENYMNDATNDIGIDNPNNATLNANMAKPLPLLGLVAFVDHKWNDTWASAIGYSSISIDNMDTDPSTFKSGQYAIVNLIYTPVENFMTVAELQYGDRTNEKSVAGYDGTSITKFQVSFKYNFGATIR